MGERHRETEGERARSERFTSFGCDYAQRASEVSRLTSMVQRSPEEGRTFLPENSTEDPPITT